MKIVVTGGAGYIGSHLAGHLVSLGQEIVIIDHFSRVPENHPWYKTHAITCIKGDVCGLTGADKRKIKGASWMFHVAGKGKILYSYRDPLAYHQSNVTGTIYALELCRELGIDRFVYPMTSAGFYNSSTTPISEDEPISCPSPYTLTKYLGEEAVLHWAQVYGLGTVSLRLFHVYGPQSPVGVTAYSRVSAALESKRMDKPFIIDGDGTYTQDFVHIDDVCRAFVLAAESEFKGEVFQIGTGTETSIVTLATLVGVATESNGKEYKSPYRGVADPSKAKKILGWKPRVTLGEGIKAIVY